MTVVEDNIITQRQWLKILMTEFLSHFRCLGNVAKIKKSKLQNFTSLVPPQGVKGRRPIALDRDAWPSGCASLKYEAPAHSWGEVSCRRST